MKEKRKNEKVKIISVPTEEILKQWEKKQGLIATDIEVYGIGDDGKRYKWKKKEEYWIVDN